MYVPTTIIFLLFYISQAQSLPYALTKRIIGGKPVAAGDATYEVFISIGDKSGHVACGGTIIHPNWVVAAGHCVISSKNVTWKAENLQIGYGNNDRTKQKHVSAKSIHVHPDYMNKDGTRKNENDLSLIEIDTLKFDDTVSKAYVYNEPIKVGEKLYSAGWGVTTHKNDDLSNELLGIIMYAGDSKECDGYVKEYTDNNGAQICAPISRSPGQTACGGDSGSGVMIKTDKDTAIAGVVSIGAVVDGKYCDSKGSVEFFVNVPYHMKFLTDTTKLTKEELVGEPKKKDSDPNSKADPDPKKGSDTDPDPKADPPPNPSSKQDPPPPTSTDPIEVVVVVVNAEINQK